MTAESECAHLSQQMILPEFHIQERFGCAFHFPAASTSLPKTQWREPRPTHFPSLRTATSEVIGLPRSRLRTQRATSAAPCTPTSVDEAIENAEVTCRRVRYTAETTMPTISTTIISAMVRFPVVFKGEDFNEGENRFDLVNSPTV